MSIYKTSPASSINNSVYERGAVILKFFEKRFDSDHERGAVILKFFEKRFDSDHERGAVILKKSSGGIRLRQDLSGYPDWYFGIRIIFSDKTKILRYPFTFTFILNRR
ncbi:hypothetical protein Glove_33g219 [Diversispora epigaea]|uniref:Uncharacterized protein n=1 Tax=Diversispora epigaea TaxID=1348612 RepID=A0A397JJY1_9GLOM|nr:hypothetical protein Glove_33g219 [Diversispora epigaea]